MVIVLKPKSAVLMAAQQAVCLAKRKRSAIVANTGLHLCPRTEEETLNYHTLGDAKAHSGAKCCQFKPLCGAMARNKPYAILKHLLSPGRYYEFRVGAVSIHGSLGFSQPSQPFKLSKEARAPSPPRDISLGASRLTPIGLWNQILQWTPTTSDLPIKSYQLSWAVSSPSEANAFEEMMRRRATLTTHEKRSLDEEEEAWGIDGRDRHSVIVPSHTTQSELSGLFPNSVYIVEYLQQQLRYEKAREREQIERRAREEENLLIREEQERLRRLFERERAERERLEQIRRREAEERERLLRQHRQEEQERARRAEEEKRLRQLQRTPAKMDAARTYDEVIVFETLRRKDVILDLSGSRNPDANARKQRAWKEVADAVLLKCKKLMTIPQIKRVWRNKKTHVREMLLRERRYREATGGGIDLDLEKSISKAAASFTEGEAELARALGREAVMAGLGKFESYVDKTSKDDSGSSPESIGNMDGRRVGGRASRQEWVGGRDGGKLLTQRPKSICDLSDSSLEEGEIGRSRRRFDSDSSSPPEKRRRSSETEVCRLQMELLKEERAIFTKISVAMDTLVSLLNHQLELTRCLLEKIDGRRNGIVPGTKPSWDPTDGDPNLALSHKSLSFS
ncbi:unnamed protein product [Cylicocyclus nassatus]|uniref:Nuclear apoptosis-inducing factor 1 n=1 Tax=Cylicocyclus nassatus TaxID=53992 RepID=A0AA36M724_CYLNA|nr:unnamed protein product [Cylicocyclus nassatus]